MMHGVDHSAVHQCLHQRTCLESLHPHSHGICAKQLKQFDGEGEGNH